MTSAPDHQVLIQYLLGALPEAEVERLDQRSIAEDEFVSRLSAAENDLVDAYVRGELSGEDLDRFEKYYLSSEKRREKVMFAEAFRDRLEKGPAASPEQALPVAAPPARLLVPAWALAAAAVVLLAPVGYLFLANGRLREALSAARSQRASLETMAEELKKELVQQRAAIVQAREQASGGGATRAMIERLQIVSFLLLPQRRGLGQAATLFVPAKTDVVALQLQLESDEFPQYEVAVRSAGDNRVVWRSGKLKSVPVNGRRFVTASLPAALLSTGHFSVELSGAASERPPELLASYAFRAVVR